MWMVLQQIVKKYYCDMLLRQRKITPLIEGTTIRDVTIYEKLQNAIVEY